MVCFFLFFNYDKVVVGCNVGYLTLSIAKNYEPRRILGIDIDDHLVGVARKNIRHYCDVQTEVGGVIFKRLIFSLLVNFLHHFQIIWDPLVNNL